MLDLANLTFRVLLGAARLAQMLTVECGEEPSLGFRAILELVPFLGPNAESLLDQIGSPIRVLCEGKPKAIKRLIIGIHKFLKFVHSFRDSDNESQRYQFYSNKISQAAPT